MRELDKAIAEQVMGWRQIYTFKATFGGKVREWGWYDKDTPDPGEDGYFTGFSHLDYPRPRRGSEWSPSTDIAAAFAVVEKLTKKHRSWKIESHDLTGSEPGLWWVRYFAGNNTQMGEVLGEAFSDSLPEAICGAALKGHDAT